MQRKDHKQKNSSIDGSRLRVGVVVSEYNADITEPMLVGAMETLHACKVRPDRIHILRVPGSFEVPLGCLTLIKKKCNAVVALGCVIKGETSHDVYIATAVSQGIMDLSLRYGVPIGFGILTPNNLAQAKARATGKTNKGKEAALVAVRMALL
jgi:6,7-dimethyl-8-ribityllumazine synthase